jgi:hypothetical protein
MSLGWARLASGVEPGGTLAPTAAAHPGVHPSGRRRSGRRGLFQLGRGQGRRHQGQAAGRVHSGRPRAKPGAGPVLDRGGPAARWRVAASRSPITGAIRSRLRQGHYRRRPGWRGQLAKVAARAYDTVGIDSFQALLGLLLIDNQMLERRGPEATWRARCWWGSASLAWLGWRCCPPTCAAAGSVASAGGGQGLRDTRIGVREGEVAEAIFTSRRHPLGIAQADRSGGSTEPNSI